MIARSILLLLATLLLAAPARAATLAERSPFHQGLWWDSSRSGHGFEIFNAANTVQVIWYTYDSEGKPIWYTAQGAESSLGREDWPLLRHRWANGRYGDAVAVGTLRLTLRNPEGADVAWRIGTRQGTWAIEPFHLAGAIPEVDHTGSWFDPANSGWGVSLTEQGDVLGGVAFTYDASGAPTWLSGFERTTNGSVQMYSATGACPGCPARATVTRAAGRITFQFAAETRLTLRTQVDLAMAPGVNADGASLTMLSRPASWRAADRQLASFAGEAGLRDYLVAGMANVSSASNPLVILPSPSPVALAPTFSATNLQEAGVDEADLVKTNGRQLYAFAHDASGQRVPRVRIARVEDAGATLVTAGSFALAGGDAIPMEEAGLLLHESSLVSVTGTRAGAIGVLPWWYSGSWLRGTTHVEIFDVTMPEAPVRRWRAEIDGHLMATRRIGSRLYLVTRSAPLVAGYRYGAADAAGQEANRQVLAATPLAGLLPGMRIDGGAAAPAVPASAIFAPPQGERRPTAEMTLVVAIDLASPRVAQTLAIAGPVDTVYASPANLYVASSRWPYLFSPIQLPAPTTYFTDIHQVRLAPESMTVAGSATVEGYLSAQADLAPFRLGEHDGRLRVVTSSGGMWGGGARNRLTILEPSAVQPGLLKTVSWLPNARRPEPLGKPGEEVYGTRFLGDRLYAVTFRMVDPLYVVDLSDSADPRIAGALEIPGFSEYLHPLPNGLLLGFGKDAVSTNGWGDGLGAWFQGLQFTLFDVSNAAAPREIRRITIGKRGSESALLASHHAFSALVRPDGSTTIAIPAAVHDGLSSFGTGPSATWPWSYSGVLRFELRGTTPATATLTQLATMVTHRVGPSSGPANDPGRLGGRVVQFADGIAYSGNGLFWRGDAAGNAAGPY